MADTTLPDLAPPSAPAAPRTRRRRVGVRGTARAAVVLVAAALLGPAAAAAAAAATPPASDISHPATITVGEPATFLVTCPDPTATGMAWNISEPGHQYVTVTDGTPVEGGVQFRADVTFPQAWSYWFQARCLYPDGPATQEPYVSFDVAGHATTTALELTGKPGGRATGRVAVTSAVGTPAGQVELQVDGVPVRYVTLVDGAAPVELTGLTGSAATVTAHYHPDGTTHTASASSAVVVPLVVTPAVALTAPASVHAGVPFTVSARVSGPAGTEVLPTGTVEFLYSEGASLGSAPLVEGVATASVVAPAAGTLDGVVAVYAGDARYGSASSSRTDVQVTPVPVPLVTVTAPATSEPGGLSATVEVIAPTPGLPAPGGDVQLIVYRPGSVPTTVTNGTLVDGRVTLATGPLPVGSYRLLAHYSGGGTAPYAQADSAEQDLVVTARVQPGTPVDPQPQPAPGHVPVPDPAPTAPAAPAPPAAVTPLAPAPEVESSASLTRPGAEVTLVARGFVPGERVTFVLHSDPVVLGTAVADANGVASLTVTLPVGVPAGLHRVVATGVDSGRTAEVGVTLAGAPDGLAATGADALTVGRVVAALVLTGAALVVGSRAQHRRA